ncbi:hypothetical protein GQ607_001343 [Colletotrichum asianum]|uniref:Uncharacterized protein n=1 Tax=Colletotrichum asianum TaxID=702518 RepID=A0A8H3ZX40_9PEZI|nr:hypothetical protein GQ607_001343 [Colletotrichum asianum]
MDAPIIFGNAFCASAHLSTTTTNPPTHTSRDRETEKHGAEPSESHSYSISISNDNPRLRLLSPESTAPVSSPASTTPSQPRQPVTPKGEVASACSIIALVHQNDSTNRSTKRDGPRGLETWTNRQVAVTAKLDLNHCLTWVRWRN